MAAERITKHEQSLIEREKKNRAFKDATGRSIAINDPNANNQSSGVTPNQLGLADLQSMAQSQGYSDITIDGKKYVAVTPGMKDNPGVPKKNLKYDQALGMYLVPQSDWLTAHKPTAIDPHIPFALAGGMLGAVVAPGVMAGGLAEAAGAGGSLAGLSQAEVAAMIEAGTVGAEGLALETTALSGGAAPAAGGLSQAIDGSAQTIYDAAANAGLPGYDTALTSGVAAGGGAGSTLSTVSTAANSASTVFSLAKLLGLDEKNQDLMKLLGPLAASLLGAAGANNTSGDLKDIYNQTRADRMPALGAFNKALLNPDTFYNSAPAMGGVDAVLRKLSISGNPATNPGSISKAAVYNLGGYNDYLRALSGPAFGTANIEANTATNAATSGGGVYDAIGYGLGNILNPKNELGDLLKNLKLSVGGVTL